MSNVETVIEQNTDTVQSVKEPEKFQVIFVNDSSDQWNL